MNRELVTISLLLTATQTLFAAIAFSQPPGRDVNDQFVRMSAQAPVVLWFLSMLNGIPRLMWPLGAAHFGVHVLIAFHLAHGWSHAAAMSHVERTSGWGEGIFVSHAFTFVWCVDAIWLLFDSKSYWNRPQWLNIAIRGFLAFIVFNATVVYGHGIARWAGAAMFAVLLFVRLRRG